VDLLLTSAGITNASIRDALERLLPKPIDECDALCIPTASHANRGGPGQAWSFVAGREPGHLMVDLGWRSVGVLELTALPSLAEDHWVPGVREADVLLVNGGDPMYLHHWMRESGLADLLPSLDALWVGLSAGSLVMTPRVGDEFVRWHPPTGRDDATLGVVDFSICPHIDHPKLPGNTMAEAERWAGTIDNPAYAIDDDTAIVVQDGHVEVVSEGTWKYFPTTR